MTERQPSLLELQRTDELLDGVAARRSSSAGDSAIDLLGAFAGALDEAPLPGLTALPAVVESTLAPDRRGRLPARRLAAALAVGLTLSSSGLAAAVTGDPLLPIKTVVRHFHDISQEPGGPDSPWILGRAEQASRGSGVDVTTSVPTAGQPVRHGEDRPSAHRVPHHATRSGSSLTVGDRAPADEGTATSGAPVAQPPGQESSTGGQPDDSRQVAGAVAPEAESPDDGSGSVLGTDPEAMRPGTTSGDPDTPGPPPVTQDCTTPDPDHPEDVPLTPCPPPQDPDDEPSDAPDDEPTDEPGTTDGDGTDGNQAEGTDSDGTPVGDRTHVEGAPTSGAGADGATTGEDPVATSAP